MNRLSGSLGTVIAVVVVAACATPERVPRSPRPLPQPGPTTTVPQRAPLPTAMGEGGTAQGTAGSVSVDVSGQPDTPRALRDWRIEDRRGHWLVVHFSQGYCATCDETARDLDQIAAVTRPQGVLTVVITTDSSGWRRRVGDEVEVREGPVDSGAAGSTAVVDPEGHTRLVTPPSAPPPTPEQVEALAQTGAVTEPVRVSVDAGAPVPRGGSGVIAVKLTMAPGHHVMSNVPSRPDYFGLRVSFKDADGVDVGEAGYPPSEAALSAGDRVSVFSGEVVVRVPFTVARDAQPGHHELKGDVRYQACTDRVCLFPAFAQPVAFVDVR